MIAGTAYGVVLNDRVEREGRAASFDEAPYAKPPVAPVLYIKPRNTFTATGSRVVVPDGIHTLEVASSLALLFGDVPNVPVAAALAIDISEPHTLFYRPAIRQRCRDGFLPLGAFAALPSTLSTLEVVTKIDGVVAHRWSLDRLVRDVGTLVQDVTEFMSLGDGDLLLVGLPGDAPQARVGHIVAVTAVGLPELTMTLVAEHGSTSR